MRTDTADGTTIATLRDATGPLPWPPLTPAAYAVAHEEFERRSDQRAALIAWLKDYVAALSPTTAAPRRVLSVGTGNGSVDAEVARTLAGSGPVRYDGIEPHAPSGAEFTGRLEALAGVRPRVLPHRLSDASLEPAGYDLVLAVHSLYYVDDLAVDLARLRTLLAPGGHAVLVHAPPSPLNRLVQLVAPGPRQPFSDTVAGVLDAIGWAHVQQAVDATVDLTPETPGWEIAVDFAVQAVVPDQQRDLLLAALARDAVPATTPGELVLPHPVDIFTLAP